MPRVGCASYIAIRRSDCHWSHVKCCAKRPCPTVTRLRDNTWSSSWLDSRCLTMTRCHVRCVIFGDIRSSSATPLLNTTFFASPRRFRAVVRYCIMTRLVGCRMVMAPHMALRVRRSYFSLIAISPTCSRRVGNFQNNH